MRGVLSQYGFTVDEYSVSRSYIDTYYAEEDADYYRALGLEPFNIESADYIFRLAVSGEQTVITIYDSDDRPLSSLWPLSTQVCRKLLHVNLRYISARARIILLNSRKRTKISGAFKLQTPFLSQASQKNHLVHCDGV